MAGRVLCTMPRPAGIDYRHIIASLGSASLAPLRATASAKGCSRR